MRRLRGAFMRRTLTILCSLIVLTTALSIPAVTAEPAAAAECPQVAILQARGSGQAFGNSANIAGLLAASADRRARAAGLSTTVTEIPYPAKGNFLWAAKGGYEALVKYYGDSVRAGIATATAAVNDVAATCGTATRIVLVGYSQGAHVVGDAFENTDYSTQQRVAALVMIADPRRNALAPSEGARSPYFGVGSVLRWSPRHVGTTELAAVRSYCTGGDTICAFQSGNWTEADDALAGLFSVHGDYARRNSSAFTQLTLGADAFMSERLGIPSPAALSLEAHERVIRMPGGARYYIDAVGRHPLPDLVAERCRALGQPTIPEHPSVESLYRTAAAVRCVGTAPLIKAVEGLVVEFPGGNTFSFLQGKRQAVVRGSGVACLQLRGRTFVRTADPYYESALLLSTPTVFGDLGCGSASVMRNRIVRHSDGDAHTVDGRGNRHWIPDQLTWACRTRQAFPVVDTARRDLVDAIPQGAWDRCPRDVLVAVAKGKVIRHTDGDAHVVDGNAVRHWIPDTLTWGCRTRAAGSVLQTRMRVHVTSLTEGGWASCDSAEWLRNALANSIVRHESGTAYQVDGAGVRHHIPDADVYACATQATPRVTTTRMWGNITKLVEGAPAFCASSGPPTWRGRLVRLPEGDSHYIDTAGVRHWVPDTVTWDCRRIMGVAVVDTADRAALTAISEGGWDNCPDVGALRQAVSGKMLRHSDGDVHYVDGSGVRHWVPDALTHRCNVERWGVAQVETVRRNYVDALTEGAWDDCGDMNWIRSVLNGKMIRHSDGDVHYVRDGVRHWVPDQLTYECNRLRWGLEQVETVRRNYITGIAEGAWDDCGDMNWVRSHLRGKILRHSEGDAHYVDGSGVRHWIPDGGVYQCLTGRGVPVVQTRVRHYVNDIPEGAWARCP